jgi:hypothetical protein
MANRDIGSANANAKLTFNPDHAMGDGKMATANENAAPASDSRLRIPTAPPIWRARLKPT